METTSNFIKVPLKEELAIYYGYAEQHSAVKLGEVEQLTDPRAQTDVRVAFDNLGIVVKSKDISVISEEARKWAMILGHVNLYGGNQAAKLLVQVRPPHASGPVEVDEAYVKLILDPDEKWTTLGEYAELLKKVRGF